MASRRTLVALVSSFALVAAGALASPASAHGAGPRRSSRTGQHPGVFGHLAALQKIADRNGGNRAALTPGYEASAHYVERTLKKAGYRTERDPFPFDREVVDTATLTENSPGSADYEVEQMEFSPNAPAGGVTADLAAPTDPLGCTADTGRASTSSGRSRCQPWHLPFSDKAPSRRPPVPSAS